MIAAAPPPRSSTLSLVAPSKPLLSQPLRWNYNHYGCYATKNNVSYSLNRALPRLSLSIRPPPRRNNDSISLFRKQRQQLCLSAFSPPPLQIKTNNNNNHKSQFLSLALSDSSSYYDDDDKSHIKAQADEEEEEKATSSSALQEVPLKIPPYLKLVTGLGSAAQLFCSLIALTINSYLVMPREFMSSPIGTHIFSFLELSTFISMWKALKRYAYVAEEHRKIINGPSKLSPRCDDLSLKKHFNDHGMLWNLLGTCLAILVMRSNCYSLIMFQEVRGTDFLSILKSCTPGSLDVDFEVWPFLASVFFLLSHLLGLACSLCCCYHQRDPINPRDVAKRLGRMGLLLLSCLAGCYMRYFWNIFKFI